MKSILFVSIAFPPKFDSEGLQVARYFKYLSKFAKGNFVIDVVTSASPTLYMTYDKSLEDANQGYRQKIEIKIFENRYLNFLLRKFNPAWILRPDSKHTFFRQWKKVVNQLKEPPSLIYSRSNPWSSAVMALKLKEYYGVPWVMHLSDPWSDSPVNSLRGKVKEINEDYEQLCFKHADYISLTSHQTIAFYRSKYPQYVDKFIYFPNVYDSDDILPKASTPISSKLKLVYTGGLAGNRSPEPFLKAVDCLPESKRERIEIVFSGIADRANKALFKKYLQSCISYIGPLATYKDAISLQQDADVLLLVDFPISQRNLRMYFLSKLLDYMIARKYIIAITGEGSVCWSIINGKMGRCFEESDYKNLANHLIMLVEEKERYSDIFNIDEINPEYDAAMNSERLKRLFIDLINSN